MVALGIIGIIVGVVLLIYLAFKGVNVIILGLLSALVVALFSGMNLVTTFTEIMVPSIAEYVIAMFGPILLGYTVAMLYQNSGAALSIAEALYRLFTIKARKNAKEGEEIVLRPVIAILIIYAIGVSLAYGGINAFVIMFILLPIGMNVFERAKIPRAMAPGVLLGALATAASSMPGTTSDPNVIASQILGTTPMAAAIPGFIGGGVVLALNIIIMNVMAKREIAKGHTYTKPSNMPELPPEKAKPHWILAVIPMVLTFVLYNVFHVNIVVALAANIGLSIILFWRFYGKIKGLKELINAVPRPAGELIFQVGCLGCVGAVVAACPVFPVITEALVNMNVPGLYKVIIVVALMAAISGSGPAGLNASLPYFSGIFSQMGISMNALHRVATFSSQTLDTLPTNPGYTLVTTFADVPINKSYRFVFITTVLNTAIAAFVVATLLTLVPGWAA